MHIFYRTAGEQGPYLLLVHGGGSDHSAFAWKAALPALAAHYRVIAVDLPGYGNSDLPPFLTLSGRQQPRFPSPENILTFHSQFLRDFLDCLKVSKAHLAGFSMGGGIALRFTLTNPGYVEKLILLNSYGLGPKVIGGVFSYLTTRADWLGLGIRRLFQGSRKWTRWGLRWSVYRKENLSDELVSDAWAAIRMSGTHPAWRLFQQQEISLRGFRSNFLADLPKLSCPLLFIHSENDRLIPVKYARNAHQQIPSSRLFVAKNAGHLLPREQPEVFHRLAVNFLSDDFRPERV